jgi:hypothetical protein
MLLSAFEGAWDVERDIADARAGQAGRFEGRAVFALVAEGLRYREEGWLTLGAAPTVVATRSYLWRAGGGGALEVRFEDGRLFHVFHPAEARPEAEHDCPPDRYRAAYDFADWPNWRVEWRVTGPRKDYAMISRFRPSGPR